VAGQLSTGSAVSRLLESESRYKPKRQPGNHRNQKAEYENAPDFRSRRAYGHCGRSRARRLDDPQGRYFNSWRHYRCNETITPAGHGLYKARVLRIIIQHLPNLADGAVDAVVSIKKNALAPNLFDDLLSGNEFAALLN
jgi:hypothetical protein